MQQNKLAWLAGFWDGEGSIGFTKNGTTFILNCQLSHTEIESVRHILAILKECGISGRGYTYQERDPEKHRDAHYIRVTGINNVRQFAKLMVKHAITKKRHWEIAIQWADSRIAVAGGIDSKGHLRRGFDFRTRKYSSSDIALYEEIKKLNSRGPKDRKDRKSSGRISSE